MAAGSFYVTPPIDSILSGRGCGSPPKRDWDNRSWGGGGKGW
jgi:hypothetical protein